MATIAASPTIHKAFRATVYDESGTLVKLAGVIYFMSDAGEVTEFDVQMAPFTCVLGELGLADTQQIMDHLHGGYAAICTSRQMEVR